MAEGERDRILAPDVPAVKQVSTILHPLDALPPIPVSNCAAPFRVSLCHFFAIDITVGSTTGGLANVFITIIFCIGPNQAKRGLISSECSTPA